MYKFLDPRAKSIVDIVSKHLGGTRPRYSDKLVRSRWYKWIGVSPISIVEIQQELNRCGYFSIANVRRGRMFGMPGQDTGSGVGLSIRMDRLNEKYPLTGEE